MRRSASARRRARWWRQGEKNEEKNRVCPLFPRRARVRAAAGLRLLPAVRARAGALSAVPGATRIFLRRWGRFHHCCLSQSSPDWGGDLCNSGFLVCGGRYGDGVAPSVAAAPAARQGAAVQAGPVLHAGELPARAGAEEARRRQRRVRGGGLDLPRPIDRRVVARLVRGSRLLRPVARGTRDEVQDVDVSWQLKKDFADQEQSRSASTARGQLGQLAELAGEKLLLRR